MKKLHEWKYKKVQKAHLIGGGPIYRIRVKNIWWHLWKTYIETIDFNIIKKILIYETTR